MRSRLRRLSSPRRVAQVEIEPEERPLCNRQQLLEKLDIGRLVGLSVAQTDRHQQAKQLALADERR